MKPTIQDTNYIVLHGWIVNRLGLTSDEALVYALIYGYKDGFDQPIAYIAQWLNASERTTRRLLRRLVQEGYITEQKQNGKPTTYTCIPRTNCHPGQSDTPTPDKLSPPTPDKLSPPLYINNNIILSSSNNACAPARERLKKWVAESSLTEWIERLLTQNGYASADIATLLDQFYDNDFRVRERCEQGERTETLRHFQNWLPKYINKLKYQNDNANPTTHRPSASPKQGATNQRLTDLNDIARSIELGLATGTARRGQQ